MKREWQWQMTLKCKQCEKSVGYCVTNGCRPKPKKESKAHPEVVKILAREWLGFEDA